MTEQEWLQCTDPQAMLDSVWERTSHRKTELYTSGSYRLVWGQLDKRTRDLIDVRERYFDGLATEAQLDSALKVADEVPHQRSLDAWNSIPPQHQVELLRDMFGNPFCPESVHPACLTTRVKSLAKAIYDERRFADMPVLADALQEAGCDAEGILSHCRRPGEHFRGCWVIDLLLGSECKCPRCIPCFQE